MITLQNKGPDVLRIGFLVAEGIDTSAYHEAFERDLASLLDGRVQGLDPIEDAWRQSVRDILRNGKYKPTGRGKPASEYLLRAAADTNFPRINAPVDVCNYISLKSLLPVSIWDLDLAGVDTFGIRLGNKEESYVFNDSGQSIDLQDLVVGVALDDPVPDGRPIVNPVKDSMTTKTSVNTTRLAAVVYSPLEEGPTGSLESMCAQFQRFLSGCGRDATAMSTIVLPGEIAGL